MVLHHRQKQKMGLLSNPRLLFVAYIEILFLLFILHMAVLKQTCYIQINLVTVYMVECTNKTVFLLFSWLEMWAAGYKTQEVFWSHRWRLCVQTPLMALADQPEDQVWRIASHSLSQIVLMY